MNQHTHTDLSPEEHTALSKELTEVLAKYNADMTVTSQIHILKRLEENKEEILSPIQPNGEQGTEESKAD